MPKRVFEIDLEKFVKKTEISLLKVHHTFDYLHRAGFLIFEKNTKKSQLKTEQDGISVDIEDQNVRFRVNSSVWNSNDGISISEFINKHFDE